MTPYRQSEETFPSRELDWDPRWRFRRGFGRRRGERPFFRRRPWDRDDSETGEPQYEEETGGWTGTPEQLAFRQQVLDAHIARTRKRRGAAPPDLTPAQLAPVRGTSVSMRADAAEGTSRLLEAAHADLAKARAAGN